jgi:UDPglucose--hexose-1-phosphate uridylyltransferase
VGGPEYDASSGTLGDEMSQLRLDPLTGRWVAINAERRQRPNEFQHRSLDVETDPGRPCPFCPGRAESEPPTLVTPGPDGSWRVLVVPNLYPAFEGREPMVVEHLGPIFTQADASGMHEVLVVHPSHDASWADLDDEQAEYVMAAIGARAEAHASMPELRYSQAIVNYGREAGASLVHPHGQLLGLPFVPGEIVVEQNGFDRFSGACLLCTTIEAELDAGARVVYVDDSVVVICPYWSGTPFEMLAIPRVHNGHLHTADAPDLAGVGIGLRHGLAALRSALGDVAYNVVFHSAPYRAQGTFHWHAHVYPKVTTRAGFELGTGVMINVVPPEEAAALLTAARV